MKKNLLKTLSFILVASCLLSFLAGCGKTPTEKADEYVIECDKSRLSGCRYTGSRTTRAGYDWYEVYVTLSFSSGEYSDLEEVVKINSIAKEFAPELEKIIAEDPTLDGGVTIFFKYRTGNSVSRWIYANGKIQDLSDLG